MISRAVSLAAMQLTINGTARTFDPQVHTVADVVRALALEGKRIAVERNGEIVPRSRYAETPIVGSDRLEIVGAVGGG
jgi:sulfur carrier protein